MSTKIILIRHGQTEWNQAKRYLGRTDIGLNSEGIKQVQDLCQQLKKEEIHKAYSSDAKRALRSAEICLQGLSIQKYPGLREIDFGIFEGLTHQEIIEKYPQIYKQWLVDPFKTAIPEGENFINFQKRVLGALDTIASKNSGKTIAVVTHAGPVKVILNSSMPAENIWKIYVKPASINIINYKKGVGSIESLSAVYYE